MNDPGLDWAMSRLGVVPGEGAQRVRARYRELMRRTHPDVSGADISAEDATEATLEITEAYRVISLAIAEHGLVPEPTPATSTPHSTEEGGCRHRSGDTRPHGVGARAEGDTILLDLPSPEAFAVLLDAGSRIGGIGYVDRNLGLLELIVRFEGGPSCSVLITLQGRAFGTDAFITMESIEAAPTPSVEPVLRALLEEIEPLLRS